VIRRLVLFLFVVALGTGGVRAAEVMPPAPRDHFNDYARIVRPETARLLNTELTQFERDTSNQLVVAIFPKLQSGSSIEDYTFRVKQAWGVGQKGQDNGAVLFIFSQDRKLYIQVGYGLEGALPDALCKRIIENEITPRFRQGDFDGGVRAGTRALMAAARGEYKGTGRTVADRRGKSDFGPVAAIAVFLVLTFIVLRFGRRRTIYSGRDRASPWISSGGWSGGGGGFSSGGGGGSFSGGGGGGGGGGAGGSW
jgi:uncharacterized protein